VEVEFEFYTRSRETSSAKNKDEIQKIQKTVKIQKCCSKFSNTETEFHHFNI